MMCLKSSCNQAQAYIGIGTFQGCISSFSIEVLNSKHQLKKTVVGFKFATVFLFKISF